MMRHVVGYDYRGTLFDDGERFVRRIDPAYAGTALDIFGLYQRHRLRELGVVETSLGGERELVHRKLVTSYPHEWTANMYKDAVLFHLDLFLELERFGLTLKDALPSNIVFDGGEPVFVDFLSLVRSEKLAEERWLTQGGTGDPRVALVRSMLVPYLLIPLIAMAQRDYPLARTLLARHSCNSPLGAPGFRSLLQFDAGWLRRNAAAIFRLLTGRGNYFADLARLIPLLRLDRGNFDFTSFLRSLREVVQGIEVTPPESGYLSYYSEKNEDSSLGEQSGWNEKQSSVAAVIRRFRPLSVLDLGCNTGWFSALAAAEGARVVAVDMDESCIDSLYLGVKRMRKVLPLAISFDDLSMEIFGVDDRDPAYGGRDFVSTPLFSAATGRLGCELVLCLGLLHHLVLGLGKSMAEVFSVLSKLAAKTLLIEFVDLQDRMILENPSFFPLAPGTGPEVYSLDALVAAAAGKGLHLVEVLPSTPSQSRSLAVFSK